MEEQLDIRNENSDKLAFRLLLVCLCAYLVHAIYAAAVHRHLYGDAAWFLVRMLSDGAVTDFYTDFARQFYYSRIVAYSLTQLPAVFVAKLGVGSWEAVSWVFGATYFLHRPLSLVVCWWLLPKGEKIAIVFPALGLFAGTINSEIYIVTETHIAVSFLWPILMAAAQVRDPGRGFFAGMILATLAAAFTYESMALLAPLLLLVVLVRRIIAGSNGRLGWSLLALAMCVAIAINWMAILFPRDPTNRSAFTGGLMKLLQDTLNSVPTMHITAVVSLAALGAVAVLVVYRLPRHRLVTVGAWFFAVLLMVLPVLHATRYAGAADFTYSITNRGFGGLAVQFGLVIVYLISRMGRFEALRQNSAIVSLLVGALALGQIGWQLIATASWQRSLTMLEASVAERRGLIRCEDALGTVTSNSMLARPAPMLCHWWVMPLSLLVAPEGKVQALYVSEEAFLPFDPAARESLPAMTYAPVDYGAFAASAPVDRKTHVDRPVSFTKGGAGTELLGRGFSHPEEWATWTDGDVAELQICAAGGAPRIASFTLAPFLTDKRPALSARVMVNGTAAGEWAFEPGDKFVERNVVLREGRENGQDRCYDLEIRFDNMRPASELGASDDPRRLGLAFIALALKDQDP